jgi:alanine racemase
VTEGRRWAEAVVDLGAVSHNVGVLRRAVAPAAVWAVVKANGYGHGAVPVARAALNAGAEGLCVALVSEGEQLREAGLSAPILVLSEQPPALADRMVQHRLTPTLYSSAAVEAMAEAVARAGQVGVPVHVKVDTGMHRAGADPVAVPAVLAALGGAGPRLRLAGLYTHLASADDPASGVTQWQLERFSNVLASVVPRPPLVHAANSAGALAHPSARLDLVRSGIALYGIEPGPGVARLATELRPALTLTSRVSFVRRVAAGEGVSYGLTRRLERPTTLAVVPIGYADGVPRRLGNAERLVLLRGVPRTVAGVVTMDQLMLDCGDDEVAVGDEVVLLGAQGQHRVRPEDWASRLGTIGYEIVCGLSARVPRRYVSSIDAP